MRAVIEIRNGCVYTIGADMPCEVLVVDHDDQIDVAGKAVSSTTIWELTSHEGPISTRFAEAREEMNTGYVVEE